MMSPMNGLVPIIYEQILQTFGCVGLASTVRSCLYGRASFVAKERQAAAADQ
jgi:hypothetical protein